MISNKKRCVWNYCNSILRSRKFFRRIWGRKLRTSFGILCLVTILLYSFVSIKEPTSVYYTADTEQYAVSTVVVEEKISCNIPTLYPFHPSVLKYLKKPRFINCTSKFPLLFTTDMNSNLIRLEDPTDYGLRNCFYRYIIRDNETDDSTSFSQERFPITENITRIPAEHEFIAVSCKKNKKKIKHVDMFAFVPLKPDIENQTSKSDIDSEESENEKLNVVILGIDATSHMNFQRAMPLTHAFLTKDLLAHGMNGYTKVGDNTFPNLVPVLSGLDETELISACWPTNESFFDSCNFVWKDYSAEGFKTSWGEDAPWMSTFYYLKQGFITPPVDYYLQPLLWMLDDHLGSHVRYSSKLCYGPRLAFEVMLNYIQKMAVSMRLYNQKYFQFLWSNSLTHDSINLGKQGDKLLYETLEWMRDEYFLNNTILVLMSDHGIRWGGIRKTYQGKIEERMPFLYIVTPKWFSEKYPLAWKTMAKNTNRLTTPFDLYETLKDLSWTNSISDIELGTRSNVLENLKEELSTPRGISLFLPIPLDRTCELAGIPESWCVCYKQIPISVENNTLVDEAADDIIDYMNNMFLNSPQCASLTLSSVFNAQILQTENTAINKKRKTLEMSFVTEPGNATFDAVVSKYKDHPWKIKGKISRTNLYGNQSYCVSDYNLKKYCYCK